MKYTAQFSGPPPLPPKTRKTVGLCGGDKEPPELPCILEKHDDIAKPNEEEPGMLYKITIAWSSLNVGVCLLSCIQAA